MHENLDPGCFARCLDQRTGVPLCAADLTEFYTLIHVAVPDILGSIYAFHRTYENPIVHGQDADATDAQVKLGAERSAELLHLCKRFMLRRTCAVLKVCLLPSLSFLFSSHLNPFLYQQLNTVRALGFELLSKLVCMFEDTENVSVLMVPNIHNF